MKPFLVFDFDGTIADTKKIYYSLICEEAKKLGLACNQVDRIIDMGFNLRKILRKLGFNFLSAWFLHHKIMSKAAKELKNIKKCAGIDDIKSLRCEKIILSNSPEEFMMPILSNLGIKKYFSGVYGSDSFSDKSEFLKEYIEYHHLNPKHCFYIGDRRADVEVAKKAGCISIIISGRCAWDSKKELLDAEPDFISGAISDIREIIKSDSLH